jgi:hypothetical protein
LVTKIAKINDNHATPNTFWPTVVSFHVGYNAEKAIAKQIS